MGGKRFLFVFGLLGGIASGLVTAALLDQLDPGHFPLVLYPVVLAINVLGFTVGGWLTWLRWARSRQQARARIIAQLASGNLATEVAAGESQEDVRRLILSLRRALFQVQRVTANVHRTGRSVGEQARIAARGRAPPGRARWTARWARCGGMGDSLQVAGKRRDPAGDLRRRRPPRALTEMTERIEQVASALAHARRVRAPHHRAGAGHERAAVRIAASGDELARFASEAEDFVAAVEGGIDAVRRRASETGELAREVTSTAERGEALVDDCVKGMYRVEETVRKAAEIVDSLGRALHGDRPHRGRHPGDRRPDQPAGAQRRDHRRAGGRAAAAPSAWWRTRSAASPSAPRAPPGRSPPWSAGVRGAVDDRGDAGEGGPRAGDRGRGARRPGRLGAQGDPRHHPAHLRRGRGHGRGDGAAGGAGRGTWWRPRRRVASRVDELTRAVGGAGRGTAASWCARRRRWPGWPRGLRTRPRGRRAPAATCPTRCCRLTAAIEEIRAAHAVLTRGDAAISRGGGAGARGRAQTVHPHRRRAVAARSSSSSHEAASLEAEVFRFRLPEARRGRHAAAWASTSRRCSSRTRGLDPLFTLDNQMVEIGASIYAGLLR